MIDIIFSIVCSLAASSKGTAQLYNPKNLEYRKLPTLKDNNEPITAIIVEVKQYFLLC